MTVPTTTYCEECRANNNGTANYCPECGAEEPWIEEPTYDMDDVDFPVIVEYEHYDDDHGMWRTFTQQVFGCHVTRGQVANMPSNIPRMKYTVTSTYWKVTENSIDGPYKSKKEAREA